MPLLVKALFLPRQAAELLKATPRWVMQFVALAVVSIIVTILMYPHIIRMTLDHLPSSATAQDKQVVEESLRGELGVRCAFLPFRLLIGWVSFALALFYVCKSWRSSEQVRFAQLFALEVHAESVLVIGQAAALVAQVHAASAISAIPFGLDMLFESKDALDQLFLNSINIFSFWYVLILTIGVSVMYKFHLVKASVCVVVTWGLSILFNVAVTMMLKEALHF